MQFSQVCLKIKSMDTEKKTGEKSLVDLQLDELFRKIGGVEMESSSETLVELEPPHYPHYSNNVVENAGVILALVGAGAGIAISFLITGEVNTHNWGDLATGVGVKFAGGVIGAISGAELGGGTGLILSYLCYKK